MSQSSTLPAERSSSKPAKAGKKKSGWTMVGVYLSPEAAKRLKYAQIAKGADRSTIVDNLVLAHLDNYVFQRRVASSVSTLDDVEANFTGPIPATSN
jgi:hypothetical protein